MKQIIIDDWFDLGTATPQRLARPDAGSVAKKRAIRRRPVSHQGSQGTVGQRRSVFDVWQVLLVMAVMLLPVSVLADSLPNGALGQPEAVCLAESLSAHSVGALESALAGSWEGAIRLALCLMFVALIGFRLWRDE